MQSFPTAAATRRPTRCTSTDAPSCCRCDTENAGCAYVERDVLLFVNKGGTHVAVKGYRVPEKTA